MWACVLVSVVKIITKVCSGVVFRGNMKPVVALIFE